MSYESVDAIQSALVKNVFHYAKDKKKAAGRALGTLVEIITFYLIKSWGLERYTAIERHLPEYANAGITHNVEFSLHPSENITTIRLANSELPITPKKIHGRISSPDWAVKDAKTAQLLSADFVLRNACLLHEDDFRMIVAYLGRPTRSSYEFSINKLKQHPFAVLECKRVGVEEGTKKGPQTIEKAKQGAYVARTISSLQKIRMNDGSIFGAMHLRNSELLYKPYIKFLQEIIESDDPNLLRHFTLTVGVVSNHGNWFTSGDHNKELKVLAQSYDWLLFLSDDGLAAFCRTLLDKPKKRYKVIKDAFINSYTGQKGANKFTKVQIALDADLALQDYFSENIGAIEAWFNIISPPQRIMSELKRELLALARKNWGEILR